MALTFDPDACFTKCVFINVTNESNKGWMTVRLSWDKLSSLLQADETNTAGSAGKVQSQHRYSCVSQRLSTWMVPAAARISFWLVTVKAEFGRRHACGHRPKIYNPLKWEELRILKGTPRLGVVAGFRIPVPMDGKVLSISLFGNEISPLGRSHFLTSLSSDTSCLFYYFMVCL